MNFIVTLFTSLVATGLLWLTIKGAYALTGSVPITLVLCALVVIQWAAARRGLMAGAAALRGHGSGHWPRALGFAVLWLTSATVTVSFVGAELYGLFSARHAAQAHFDAERGQLQARARELDLATQTLVTASAQYAKHARSMAAEEEAHGNTCAVGRGAGPGEIRNFRRQDRMAAESLQEQVGPIANQVQVSLRSTRELSFEADVRQLRDRMGGVAADINSQIAVPVWAQVEAFVVAQTQAGLHIPVPGQDFRCDDNTRSLLLGQMLRTARALAALKPVPAVTLLDPADSRELTQVTLIRTWAGVLEVLPSSLWHGKPLVDDTLKQRYGLSASKAVLGQDNLPLVMAWLLEIILIALLILTGGDARSYTADGPGARLKLWMLNRLQARGGLVGQLAQTLGGPTPAELDIRPLYVDAERLFANPAMEERAYVVAPWYRPWGGRDIVAIPLDRGVAVRAGRELWRAGLLRRLATGIDTAALLRDRRLANVMTALGGPVPDTVWEVFQICDEHFARWLLSQPVEARRVLGMRT